MNDDVYEFMIRFEIDDLHILNWPSLSNDVIITSISQLSTASLLTTNITIVSGIGNNMEITELDFTRFIFLKQINIGSNALNRISAIIATNLTQLIAINIGEGSLTSIQT